MYKRLKQLTNTAAVYTPLLLEVVNARLAVQVGRPDDCIKVRFWLKTLSGNFTETSINKGKFKLMP